MRYNYYFDIAAVMLDLMLLFNIYIRRTYPSKQCLLYKAMLWLNLVSSVFDWISATTITDAYSVSLAANYFVNGGYLLAHNLTAVAFFLYAVCLVRGNHLREAERTIVVSVTTFEVVGIFTSPLLHTFFYFDENRKYTHGPLMPLLYVAAFVLLVYALVLFIRHRHVLNSYQMAINILFQSLLMSAVIFQYFFPYTLIESFVAAIAFMMMNVGLDNPEMYFYQNTYCFNQNAFAERVTDKLEHGTRFAVVGFSFSDIVQTAKAHDAKSTQQVLHEIIRVCKNECHIKDLFILSSNAFAVCPVSVQETEDVINTVSSALHERIRLGDAGLSYLVDPHFCVLRLPDEYKNAEDVTAAINSMLFDVYRSTGEHVIASCADTLRAKRREAQIVHLLHEAFSNDGLEVYYQQIYSREKGRFSSAEALVRMKNISSGFIGPDEFIPVAEENGLVATLGEIVFDKVCRFLAEHDLSQYGIDYIEVNLAKTQLINDTSVRHLEEIAERYGIAPSKINFEITETAGINIDERAIVTRSMCRLREKGFTFALDDYGSGFSDVAYIAESPFNLVKLDHDILWNAMNNPRFRVVLESSMTLIHALQ